VTKKISRRRAVAALGAGVTAAAVPFPFLTRKANATGGQVVLSSWGGSFQKALRKAYFEPFEKETGIKVVEHTYGIQALAKLKAQMAAGGAEMDLLDGPPFWTAIGRKGGLTDKIDYQGFVDPSDHMPKATPYERSAAPFLTS